jgi:hypothetical protein
MLGENVSERLSLQIAWILLIEASYSPYELLTINPADTLVSHFSKNRDAR